MHHSYNAGMRMPTPAIPQPQGPAQGANYTGYNYNGFQGRRLSKSEAVVSELSSVLEHADNSELQELHDSEERLHQMLDENNMVKQLEIERMMQLAQNRSIAEDNMKKGPTLSACKQRLAELYKQLNEQTRLFDENKRNLASLSSQYNPDTIMALLQTSVAQSEETSENTANSFMDGDLLVDDFLEKYLKERIEIHIQRTKVDKLKEIMRR